MMNGDSTSTKDTKKDSGEMTSKDYYFDSYAHFGIHEVCLLKVHLAALLNDYLLSCSKAGEC